jgi:hypothetical protein
MAVGVEEMEREPPIRATSSESCCAVREVVPSFEQFGQQVGEPHLVGPFVHVAGAHHHADGGLRNGAVGDHRGFEPVVQRNQLPSGQVKILGLPAFRRRLFLLPKQQRRGQKQGYGE